MSSSPDPRWELVREFGLEYAEDDGHRGAVLLTGPVASECVPGLGYLVVDETPVPGVLMRTHCRTLLLSTAREVVYDSMAQGIDDGFGCVMDGERFALLRRKQREILVLSRSGECTARIDLSGISASQPRNHCWTFRSTFLVTFVTLEQPFDIVELDMQGRVLWRRSGPADGAGLPASMQLLANDSILIANETAHVVEELRRDGSTRIRWGKTNSPSVAHGYLSAPKWARQLNDGTLLVADAYNHRCLAIDPGGRVTDIQPKERSFFVPCFVTRAPDGNYLVCDSMLCCIFELDTAGRIVWQMGTAVARRRHFSFPRSVQYLDGGRYLVADTAHNRIVESDGRRLRGIPANGDGNLFWPRAARRTGRGTFLIADGRNSRVFELTADGRILREAYRLQYLGRNIQLRDPHDIRELPNLNLLITDSANHLVCETDWDGRIAWVAGLGEGPLLNDPHSAQMIPDGRILIADSGNHRVLLLDPCTGASRSIAEIASGDGGFRLNYPRHAAIADSTLMIVDSHNSRVFATDLDGTLRWELSQVPGSPLPFLSFPRWAHLIDCDELVVSDHFNHRIVHLRRRSGSEIAAPA